MLNRPKVRAGIVYLLPAAVLLLLSACSSQRAGSPTITIASPMEGLAIASSNVTVSVVTNNFKLVDKTGALSGGQNVGHVIFYLDVTPPTHEGRTALTQRGTCAAAIDAEYTWENVRPGPHTLGVQLVTSDNMPLNIPLSATVKINVVRPPTEPVTRNLIATYNFFDINTISVPAGAEVILTFVNEDAVPHNFSVYRDSSASNPIFRGPAVTGPSSIIYRFKAPGMPGDYIFRSDSNPEAMTGTLRVTSG
jgi:plastocyanin